MNELMRDMQEKGLIDVVSRLELAKQEVEIAFLKWKALRAWLIMWQMTEPCGDRFECLHWVREQCWN